MTVDLAGFLLARIEEDEASARRVQVPIPPDRDPITGEWKTVPGAHKPGDRRLLAECEAKRAIVKQYRELLEQEQRFHEDMGGGELALALQHLAAVYASHEQFREEWRV